MKKLTIYTGGHPDSADDLIHLQEAFTEGFQGVFSAFLDLDKNYILKGCEVSVDANNQVYSVTEGYIFYRNEVFKVNAQSIYFEQSEAVELGWRVQTTYRDGNPVVYASGIFNNPHEIRTLEFVSENTELLHQDLYYTEVHQGVEEGIVYGFDLKKPEGYNLIFNGLRSGKDGVTEIVYRGKRWQIRGDITASIELPSNGSFYQDEEFFICCIVNEYNNDLIFKSIKTGSIVPDQALILGKLELKDPLEKEWNVQQLYNYQDYRIDEILLNLKVYKAGNTLISYRSLIPYVKHYLDTSPTNEWLRQGIERIKVLIDTKLQGLYAEVVSVNNRPFLVNLFGYLAFTSSQLYDFIDLKGNADIFFPKSNKTLNVTFYYSDDDLESYTQVENIHVHCIWNSSTYRLELITDLQLGGYPHFIGFDTFYYI